MSERVVKKHAELKKGEIPMKKQRIAAALMASVMAFSTISSNVFADDIVASEAVSLEEAVLSESALAAEEADTAEDKTAEEENEVRVFADGFSDGVNGNVGKNYSCTADADGNVNLKITTANKGKFTNGADNYAYYAKEVSTQSDFSLSATININEYNSSAYSNPTSPHQSSFGVVGFDEKYSSDGNTGNQLWLASYTEKSSVPPAMTVLTRHKGDATKTVQKVLSDSFDIATSSGTFDVVVKKSGSTYYLECNGNSTTVTDAELFTGATQYIGFYVARNADITISNIEFSEDTRTVTALTLKQAPEKSVYAIGDELDLTGAVIEAAYSDGSTEEVALNELVVSGFDTASAGEKTMTFVKGGVSATFDYTVNPDGVVSLEFDTEPYINEYAVDMRFDPSGAKVKATLNTGEVIDVVYIGDYDPEKATEDEKNAPKYTFLLNGSEIDSSYIFKSSDAGTDKIEIKAISGEAVVANDVKGSFDVTISDRALAELTVAVAPIKTEYYVGDSFEPAGMVIRGTYRSADGSKMQAVIPEGDYRIDAPEVFTTAGTVTVPIVSTINPSIVYNYNLDIKSPRFTRYKVVDYPIMTVDKGAPFDPTGLVIGAYFSNAAYEVADESEYSIDTSSFDSSNEGTTSVTVNINGKYGTQSIPLNITVKETAQQIWRHTYFGASTNNSDTGVVDITNGALSATDANGRITSTSDIIAEDTDGKNAPYYDVDAVPTVTVASLGGAGKITADNDGISYYFTRLAAQSNFTMTAKLEVEYYLTDNDDKQRNGQEAFGVMVRDAVPFFDAEDVDKNGDANSPSLKNSVAAAKYAAIDKVTGEPMLRKTNDTFASNMAIIGGCADSSYPTENDVSFIRKSTSNRINLLARIGTADHIEGGGAEKRGYYKISDTFPAVGNVYYLTIKKSGNGIYAKCEDPQNLDENGNPVVMETYQYFEDGFLDTLDPDNMYVGIFAARRARVKASEIVLTETDPATDIQTYVAPEEASSPTITVASPYFTTDSNYELILKAGNELGGTVTIKNGDEIVKRDVFVTKKGMSYNIALNPDSVNHFTVIYSPNKGDNLTAYKDVISEFDVTHRSSYNKSAPYIYAGPDGTASAAGTREDPLDIQSAIGFASRNQTVICLDGVYYPTSDIDVPESSSGYKSKPVRIFAEDGADVVLDFQGLYEGVIIRADNWHIKGLDVTNTADNLKGFHLAGNNCIVEDCKFHDNGDTGFQVSRIGSGGDSIDEWPSNNLILNCESYNNADPAGINADGFGAKLTVGTGNVFEGCISHHNLDDGWDTFTKQGSGAIGTVVLEGCVSYKNGYELGENGKETSRDKGGHNGFKMGGENVAVQHYLKDCIAYKNGANGVTTNSNPQLKLRNVIAYKNGGSGIALYSKSGKAKFNYDVEGAVSYQSARDTIATVTEDKTFTNNSSTPLVSESNYFNWGSSSANAKYASAEDEANRKVTTLDTVTDDFFVSVNEADSITDGFYAQDADGKFILGDFLARKTPYVHKEEDLIDLSSYGFNNKSDDTPVIPVPGDKTTESTTAGTNSGSKTGGNTGGGGGGGSSARLTTSAAATTETEKATEKTTSSAPDTETITVPDVSSDSMFDDISNKPWAEEAINALASMGIVNGTGYRTFTPDANCKRADFAIMLVKLLGIEGTATDNFDDVAEGKYYYNFVGLAKEAGIVNGYGDGNFGPENFCTREELMVMVANALASTGVDITADQSVLDKFGDAADIADWAKPYVAFLAANSVVNGSNGNIDPKADITRAEVAVIMYNVKNAFGFGAEEEPAVVEEETEETTEEASEETSEETTEETEKEAAEEVTEKTTEA